jgi:tetratricopeptide (TPR) repeat protein
VQLAEKESHSAIKAELLSSLAIIYRNLGENEKSEELLARSRQLIEEDDDLTKDCYECPSKEFFRIVMAVDHAVAGQRSKAVEMLNVLVDLTRKASAERRGQILAGLASVYAGIGSSDRAIDLLNEALEIARTATDGIDILTTLEDIAKRFALLGRLERAVSIAGMIEKGPFKDHALITIASKYAETGQLDRALRINSEVGTTNFKPDILIAVAKQYLKRGEKQKASVVLHQALSASNRVTADNLKQFARRDIALLLAEAGQYDQALRIVRAIDAQSPKLHLLTQLASVMARAGRASEAERLLAEGYQLTDFSKGTYYQAVDLLDVARGYASVGKKEHAAKILTEAASVLNTIEDPSNKNSLFGDVALLYLEVGENDSTLRTVDFISDDSRAKVMTLIEIASKLAKADDLMKQKEKIINELMQP